MTAAALLSLALAMVPSKKAAEDAFVNGDYETALEYLEHVYLTEPNPDPKLLFARASTLEKLGRFEEAIVAYEVFLATAPERDEAEKAYARIQACRRALEAKAPPEPPPPPPPTEGTPKNHSRPPAENAPPRSPHRPRRWYQDPLGDVLAGGGVALGVAGGVMVGLGAQRRGDAGANATEGAFRDDLRSSNTLQGVGIGLAVSGGLLLTGAVLRYVAVGRASSDDRGLAVRF